MEMGKIELLEDAVFNSPLSLMYIKDKESINYINQMLPYSVGMEFEIKWLPNGKVENFKDIPYLMELNCDSFEKRFRVPYGICGMICIYLITRKLRENCYIDYNSGIHYHIDMTDVFKDINLAFIKRNESYVIRELRNWGDNLDENSAYCSFDRCWCKYSQAKKTLEIRVGEMTFDYNTIINRAIHGNVIVKTLKEQFMEYQHDKIEFPELDAKLVADYLLKEKCEVDLKAIKDKVKNKEVFVAPKIDVDTVLKKRKVIL